MSDLKQRVAHAMWHQGVDAAIAIVLEEAARVAEPTPTKCVCVELAMDGVWFCDCGCTNSEDYAQAASWCERANIAIAIRALAKENT